ncbi:MAG: hypothetical protein ABW127_00105 [Candidatus Thiodiazotropha endolucinida]
MRPLVWVVRGTKALDSMGVQGESEVSTGCNATPKRCRSHTEPSGRMWRSSHLVKIAIKRL